MNVRERTEEICTITEKIKAYEMIISKCYSIIWIIGHGSWFIYAVLNSVIEIVFVVHFYSEGKSSVNY